MEQNSVRKRRRAIWGNAISVTLLLGTVPAFAQESDKAAAEVLFQEGVNLLDSGKTAEACPKFATSQRLDPAYGPLFNLAECHEKLGLIASAWAEFREALDMAKNLGDKKREEKANRRATALEPKLSRLTITVSPELVDLSGLEIKKTGKLVESPLWGVAVPVDPGECVLIATAPGKKSWKRKVAIGQMPMKVEVLVPPLEDLPKPVASPNRSRIPSIISGGAAVVFIGVGGALLGLSVGKESDLFAQAKSIRADRKSCVPDATNYDSANCLIVEDTAKSADTLHNAAIGMFVVGSIAAAGAVTYLLLPASKEKKTAGLTIRAIPVAAPGQGGLVLSGAF